MENSSGNATGLGSSCVVVGIMDGTIRSITGGASIDYDGTLLLSEAENQTVALRLTAPLSSRMTLWYGPSWARRLRQCQSMMTLAVLGGVEIRCVLISGPESKLLFSVWLDDGLLSQGADTFSFQGMHSPLQTLHLHESNGDNDGQHTQQQVHEFYRGHCDAERACPSTPSSHHPPPTAKLLSFKGSILITQRSLSSRFLCAVTGEQVAYLTAACT